jgi:hypothetical protein
MTEGKSEFDWLIESAKEGLEKLIDEQNQKQGENKK